MIYVLHHDDADGIVAAWSASYSFQNTGNLVDVKYLPVQYNTPYPLKDILTVSDTVYVLDFSYSKEFIEEERKKCLKFVVLDHHKSAEFLADMSDTVFDVSKSGAMIAWEYFNPNIPVPKLVQYTQDYDLWKFELPATKEIQNMILVCGYSFIQLDVLSSQLEKSLPQVITQGLSIESYKEFCIKNLAKTARMYNFEGHKVILCSASYPNISQTGQYLLDRFPKAKFSLTYFVKGFTEYVFSLRGRGDIDLSEIAKKHGGGGHHNASGLTLFLKGDNLFLNKFGQTVELKEK